MSQRIDGFSRIRTELDISEKYGPMGDVFTGAAARFGRGARLRFEILLRQGSEIADPSLIDAARLRVLATSYPDSAIAINKAIGPAYINAGVTEEEWDTNEPDKCHLRFELTASETGEGVFGGGLADADVPHWFLLTYGAGEDLLFFGTVNSIDAGYTSSGTPPLAGTAASLDDVRAYIDAALTNFVRFSGNPAGAKIEFQAETSGKKVKIGADDNGEFDVKTKTTT